MTGNTTPIVLKLTVYRHRIPFYKETTGNRKENHPNFIKKQQSHPKVVKAHQRRDTVTQQNSALQNTNVVILGFLYFVPLLIRIGISHIPQREY